MSCTKIGIFYDIAYQDDENFNSFTLVMNKSIIAALLMCFPLMLSAQIFNTFPASTQKPPLHGRHWMAITGKPLAATAGAMIFDRGGNAVDAACAMLAATCTMWDRICLRLR